MVRIWSPKRWFSAQFQAFYPVAETVSFTSRFHSSTTESFEVHNIDNKVYSTIMSSKFQNSYLLIPKINMGEITDFQGWAFSLPSKVPHYSTNCIRQSYQSILITYEIYKHKTGLRLFLKMATNFTKHPRVHCSFDLIFTTVCKY